MAGEKKAERRLSRAAGFWAVVQYELLWNIRKKKFLGVLVLAFVFATLSLLLLPVLSNITGQSLGQNPNYVINSGAGLSGLEFFLFAVVTVMNSISGEFESGSIVPLLTKPVSRTTVFLGKFFAAFITFLSAYVVLFVYTVIGGIVAYGPQNNLYLIPLILLGNIISTLLWVSIVLALGSISKSSLIAALGTFGIFIALTISSPIISFFSNQAWILTYLPGSGALGYVPGLGTPTPFPQGMPISTGTDNIGSNLIIYALHPSSNVTYIQTGSQLEEPLSLVVLRSVIVAATYIIVFLLVSWYAFKKSQIVE